MQGRTKHLAAEAQEWSPPAKKAPSTAVAAENDPIVNIRGMWISCLHNSLLWLENKGHSATIRYDRFRGVILVDGRPLDDETIIHLTSEIEANTRSGWSQEHVRLRWWRWHTGTNIRP